MLFKKLKGSSENHGILKRMFMNKNASMGKNKTMDKKLKKLDKDEDMKEVKNEYKNGQPVVNNEYVRKSEEYYRPTNNELNDAYNEYINKKKMNRYSCSYDYSDNVYSENTELDISKKDSIVNFDKDYYDNESSENHDMSELVAKYTEKEKNQYHKSNTLDKKGNKKDQTVVQYSNAVFEYETKLNFCHICMKKVDNNCIVLGCNHVYHIPCLEKSQIKFNYLDEDTHEKKCSVCKKSIEPSEILYLHTKHFNTIKANIEEQDDKIKRLEEEMNELKLEYKRSLDIRQKLEYSREQSKKIMIYFSTMSNFT